jgi:hypothetical protein
MREGAKERKIIAVNSSEPAVRVVLDLEPYSEPISGFLEHGDAESRLHFWGWLDLLAAIEAARKDGTPATGADPRREETR